MWTRDLISTSVIYGIILLSNALTSAEVNSFSPQQDTGIPAGLIPNCPGVLKNASISPNMLPKLLMVHFRVSAKGQIIRKMMPITTAARVVAKDKYFDFKRRKTVVYSPGFLDSSLFPQNQAIATAYVNQGYNVFVSETQAFLVQIYPKSARLVIPIGKKIGEFLVQLYAQGLLDPAKLELVGASLGAHVISYAAKHFFAVTGKKPSRLTGLDPAGPCFRNLPLELRFNPSDAERVDVVHTNMDGFGMAETIGHVDFYVNGGEYQPSDIPYIPCLVICSHFRSMLYWWQALQHPKKFIAVKCKSVQDARYSNCYNNSETNYVGLETNFDKRGVYYLATNNEFPYVMGKEGLKAENEIYTSISRRINAEDYLVI